MADGPPARESSDPEEAESGAAAWSNWSGSVHCQPARTLAPEDESSIASALSEAADRGWPVRVAGSGHSFTPLVATEGLLITLREYRGLEQIDVEARRATVRAGTVLHDLNAALHEHGLALHNMGDVDVQALGGALSTGTHGTGRSLANLSSRAREVRLVTPSQGVVTASPETDPALWRAARVSLGALGVLTAATLDLVPAYRLHERVDRPPVEEGLAGLAEAVQRHRHFEFFWFPAADKLETKAIDPTDAEPESLAGVKYQRIGWSHEILPSERDLVFNEMEYSLPAEAGPACFEAVRERIRARHADVAWPVEYRHVAADDALLSMAHGRDTVSISLHQDGRLPYADFFADVEPLFWEHGGRPHWGKVHNLAAAQLRDLYPEWATFQAVRERLDPGGLMLTPALRSLLLD